MRLNLLTHILKLRYMNPLKRYTYQDIGKVIDMHENTVQRMVAGQTERIDFVVIAKWVMFFRNEGLTDFTINDLFVMEEVAEAA